MNRPVNLELEMTSQDAAAKLDVTTDRVRRLFNKGVLKGREVNRDLWLTKASVEAYKRKRRPKGRPPGLFSDEPPENRATRRKRGRGGRKKSKEELIAAGEREREYQRNYQRERRRRLKEAEQAS